MPALPGRELRGTRYRWTDPDGVTHDIVYAVASQEHVVLCVGFQPFGFYRGAAIAGNVTCMACIVREKGQYLK